ncbi:unnamed protein product, partial [Soboliphyme baturini]|uniref:WD_REPEATS_REGION domain-containing protein n=1 Tax=Soboliphyme baturini TaxID=241478 RepID=A0A183IW50_9BILA
SSTIRTGGSATCVCCDNIGKFFWVGDSKGSVYAFVIHLTPGKIFKGKRTILMDSVPVTSVEVRALISRGVSENWLLADLRANAACLYRVCAKDGSLQFYRKFFTQHVRHNLHSHFSPLISSGGMACIVCPSEDGNVYLFDFNSDGRKYMLKVSHESGPVIDCCLNHDESCVLFGDAAVRI